MSETPKPLRTLVEEWRKLLKNPPIPLSSYDAGRVHKAEDCAKALETALDQWEMFLTARQQIINDEAATEIEAWKEHILGPRGEK